MSTLSYRWLAGAVLTLMVTGSVAAKPLIATVAVVKPSLASAALDRVAERYFEDFLKLNPLVGSSTLGEARFEDKFEIVISPAHRLRSKALYQRVQRELVKLDKKQLTAADALTVALLNEETSTRLEALNYPSHLMPIDQYGGVPVELAQFGSGQDIQPLKTVRNFENYLKRLNRLPAWIDQSIINMKAGIRTGIVMPRPLIERALPSLQAMTQTDVEKSVFYSAMKIMPTSFSANDRFFLEKLHQR